MTILTTTEKFDFLSIESWCFMDRLKAVRDPGGGVLPYMAYTGMCRWTGYGFWPQCPKQGM